MYYSPTLDINITDKVWRIIRMAKRGRVHIYGIDKKEYHKRMKESDFLAKDADVLLKEFKDDKLKKFIGFVRSVIFDIYIACCESKDITMMLYDREILEEFIVEKGKFTNSLLDWVDVVTTNRRDNLLSDICFSYLSICDDELQPKGYEKGIKVLSFAEEPL